MTGAPPDPIPAITPAQFRERRLALGLTILQVAERAGIGVRDLLRFEEAGGDLREAQRVALFHALGQAEPPPPPTAPHPASRALLDMGIAGPLIFFLAAAIPLTAAVGSVGQAVRILGADAVEAEVVGFERGTAVSQDRSDRSVTIPTLAPILRFASPDRTGEVTITLNPVAEDLNRLATGDRLRLYIPPGAPEQVEFSIMEALLRPFVIALLALPLLICGRISLRHWRRRRASRG